MSDHCDIRAAASTAKEDKIPSTSSIIIESRLPATESPYFLLPIPIFCKDHKSHHHSAMGLFNTRVKTPLHIVYIILVVAAMGLSVPRLFMKGQPRTRANTIALGMVNYPIRQSTPAVLRN